jgi:hypothetical protein
MRTAPVFLLLVVFYHPTSARAQASHTVLSFGAGGAVSQGNGFGNGLAFRFQSDTFAKRFGFLLQGTLLPANKRYASDRSGSSVSTEVLILPRFRFQRYFSAEAGAAVSATVIKGFEKKTGFGPAFGLRADVSSGRANGQFYGRVRKDLTSENRVLTIAIGGQGHIRATKHIGWFLGAEGLFSKFSQPFVAGTPTGNSQEFRIFGGVSFVLTGDGR